MPPRGFARKKRSSGAQSKPVSKAVKKYVKKAILTAPEIKLHTVNTTIYFDDTATGNNSWISAVPQGDTGITRDGRALRPTKLVIKGLISNVPATAIYPSFHRLMLIKVRNTEGAVPDIRDFINATTLYGHQSIASKGEVQILKQHYFATSGTAGDTSNVRDTQKWFGWSINLTKFGKTTFKTDAVAIADSDDNHYFLVATSNTPNGGAVNTKSFFIFQSDLYFTP